MTKRLLYLVVVMFFFDSCIKNDNYNSYETKSLSYDKSLQETSYDVLSGDTVLYFIFTAKANWSLNINNSLWSGSIPMFGEASIEEQQLDIIVLNNLSEESRDIEFNLNSVMGDTVINLNITQAGYTGSPPAPITYVSDTNHNISSSNNDLSFIFSSTANVKYSTYDKWITLPNQIDQASDSISLNMGISFNISDTVRTGIVTIYPVGYTEDESVVLTINQSPTITYDILSNLNRITDSREKVLTFTFSTTEEVTYNVTGDSGWLFLDSSPTNGDNIILRMNILANVLDTRNGSITIAPPENKGSSVLINVTQRGVIYYDETETNKRTYNLSENSQKVNFSFSSTKDVTYTVDAIDAIGTDWMTVPKGTIPYDIDILLRFDVLRNNTVTPRTGTVTIKTEEEDKPLVITVNQHRGGEVIIYDLDQNKNNNADIDITQLNVDILKYAVLPESKIYTFAFNSLKDVEYTINYIDGYNWITEVSTTTTTSAGDITLNIGVTTNLTNDTRRAKVVISPSSFDVGNSIEITIEQLI